MDGAANILIGNYIWSRIAMVKSAHKLSNVRLAEIMDFQRSALLRAMKNGRPPRIESLYKLSSHFGLPMAYWFPVCDSDEIESVVLVPSEPAARGEELQAVKALLKQFTPLTKDMLREIQRLSPKQKRVVTVLALRHPDLIADALKVAVILKEMAEPKRQKMVKAMQKIASEKNCEPAP